MKKQHLIIDLIIDLDIRHFQKQVNEFLELGWKVVPGTLVSNMVGVSPGSRIILCMVVVEKDV